MKNGHVKLLLGLSTIFGLVFGVPASATKSDSVDVDVEFTFTPYLNVTFTSNNLVIDNLTPGTTKDSNSTNINVKTNNIAGYTMFATVGSTTYDNRQLANTNPSITGQNFEMVSTDTATTSLLERQWGYHKVTGSTTADGTWSADATTFSGLPLFGTSGDGEIISSSTVGPINHTVPFSIGAKAATNQSAGTYTNVINFTIVANAVPVNWAP